MIQKTAFSTAVRVEGSRAKVVVTGPIDERSDFAPATTALAKARISGIETVGFDLSGVDQLNSIGAKKWISFLSALQLQRFTFCFERISELIVAQANSISALLGPPGTVIQFIAAPYRCDKCDKAVSREINQADLADNGDGGFSAPELSCADCGGPLAFDEYEDEYFFFLRHSKTTARA